jgi:hypothetical protein
MALIPGCGLGLGSWEKFDFPLGGAARTMSISTRAFQRFAEKCRVACLGVVLAGQNVLGRLDAVSILGFQFESANSKIF